MLPSGKGSLTLRDTKEEPACTLRGCEAFLLHPWGFAFLFWVILQPDRCSDPSEVTLTPDSWPPCQLTTNRAVSPPAGLDRLTEFTAIFLNQTSKYCRLKNWEHVLHIQSVEDLNQLCVITWSSGNLSWRVGLQQIIVSKCSNLPL